MLERKVLEFPNKIVVVSPLNSIIDDQSTYLKSVGLDVEILGTESNDQDLKCLFERNEFKKNSNYVSPKLASGQVDFIYAHPEGQVSDNGRKLLLSKPYKDSVIAVVIDEAHCVEFW